MDANSLPPGGVGNVDGSARGKGGAEDGGFKTMFGGKPRTTEEISDIQQRRADSRAAALKAGTTYLTKNQKKNNKHRLANRNRPYDKPSVTPETSEGSEIVNPLGNLKTGPHGGSKDSLGPITKQIDHMNTVYITRVDEQLLDFEDITFIRAEIGTAEIKLIKSKGINPHDISVTFQKGLSFNLICNTWQAVTFYKDHINTTTRCDLTVEGKPHKGFLAYDTKDKPRRYQITGEVHRSHSRNQDDLHYAFVGGSCQGYITEEEKNL